ncbi:cyclase family protein [Actinomadura madurae]|nr:cyclase family protein [Actinomadura madurae]MCP9980820.1 cyclase family protein [Actinomadura madurae]
MIDADALARAVDDAGAEVLPGDVLCVRTGWMRCYWESDTAGRDCLARSRRWPGLAGSASMAELLWDWRVSAVTADNPAVEAAPGRPGTDPCTGGCSRCSACPWVSCSPSKSWPGSALTWAATSSCSCPCP